jgi:hypothetical protein
MAQATFKIKIWFALAITTVSLVLASSASAMHNAADAGGAIAPAPTVPVVDTSGGGFDWVAALIGAAVAAAAILVTIAVARLAHGRGRLAASH